MSKVESEFYTEEIEKLNQLECWAIIAGEGTGSHVDLFFGQKIVRKKPLTNPYLSDVAKKFDSEFSLFVEECAWRVESGTEVLCGSMSENSNDGIMLNGLMALLNQKVSNVVFLTPSLDLKIEFKNGLKFILFCNTFFDDEDNYSFFSPSNVFTAKGYGHMVIEKRSPNKS